MSTLFKKLATYLLEGVTVMNEYWIIALLHEIGRHTVFYGTNVNSPHVGYFVTTIFVMFYLGRLLGELIAVGFVNGRKFVLIAYTMAIPMIIAMFLLGLNTGAFWIMIFRAAVGFLSSYEPALCILRTEVNKTHLVKEIIKQKAKGGDTRQSKKISVPGIHRYLQAIIHFFFQYGSMVLVSYLYNWEAQNIKTPVLIVTIIAIIMLIIFIIAFKCYEPQKVDQLPLVKEYFEQQREDAPNTQTYWRSEGFFKLLFADDDLMWDTISARIYEAARMLDLVFMSVMVQTNPFYKGLFFDRNYVMLAIFIAAAVSLPISILFAKIVTGSNARKWMIITYWFSMFFYPLSATLVNAFDYKSGKWAYVVYCICELIKFILAFIVREGLKELILATHSRKSETFKAAGSLFENFFKTIVFGLGYFITWFMASNRIQKMNPFNYTVAFLVVIPCFMIAYFSSVTARALDKGPDDDKEK